LPSAEPAVQPLRGRSSEAPQRRTALVAWPDRRRAALAPPGSGRGRARQGDSMHAALITVTIDPSQAPAAAAALMNDILPRITAADGFAAGHWLEPHGGQGLSILLFDTEEHARQAADASAGWSAPGVSVDQVEIRRVAVSVP
jgi:hypothetical protein